MKRLFVLALATIVSLGAWTFTAPKAEAGVRIGIGIGFGYGRPYYGYPRYYRPRYYRPRYRRVYRARRHRARRGVNAHVNWCARRYRSYRVSSDTFRPFHGPRRRCRSPYR